MSWFGSSLNTLTGQLTNFTREVLTEGTEEISDHATELNACRDQIQDFSNQCQVLRQEVERLRSLNAELEDKSQSAELQIASISTEYRTLLDKKDGELKSLKKLQDELQSHHHDQGSAGGITFDHAFRTSSANESDDIVLQSDYFDLRDVIDNSHDINKSTTPETVRSTVSTECVSAADDQKNESLQHSKISLTKRIKELESQLTFEVDQHQNELSVLQDFHEQKYSRIKKQHDEDIAKLQSSLSFYENQSDLADDDPSSTSLSEAFRASVTEIKNLKKELAERDTSDGEKTKTIQLLNRQLNQTLAEKNTVEAELSKIGDEHDAFVKINQEMRATIDHLQDESKAGEIESKNVDEDYHNHQLVTENESLLQQQSTLMSKVAGREQELKSLQTEHNSALKSLEELNAHHQDAIEQILASKTSLVEQNRSLKEKIQSCEDRLQQNQEVSKTDMFPLSLLEEQLDPDLVKRITSGAIDVTFELILNIISALHAEKLAVNDSRDYIASESEMQIDILKTNLESITKEHDALIQTAASAEEVALIRHKDLKAEVERLTMAVESKEEDMLRLQEKVKELEASLNDAETKVETLNTVESRSQETLSQFVNLQSEYAALSENLNEKLQTIEELKFFKERSNELEEKIAGMASTERINALQSDMKVQLKKVEELNLRFEESEEECKALRLQLTNSNDYKVTAIDDGKESTHKKSIEELAVDYSSQIVSQVSEGSSGGSDFEIVGKDDGSDQSASSKEFEKVEDKESDGICDDLSQLLLQKDSEIKELQEKILHLSEKLLDSQSPSAEGSTLEQQVDSLKFEKEQILSVMNEKLKECSTLKTENHQLMGLISAEKQAISKLQQDNEELMKLQKDCSDPELTKETIQNLSRLIRDKDLEINALCQKNNVLDEMFQNRAGAENENRIKILLEEKEALMKERNAYRSDREQILNALNQKHQESVTYHSELQKLQQLLSEEKQKYDNLETKHKSMCDQFEGKQKTLLDVQNELIIMKQKFSSLEQEQSNLKANYSSILGKHEAPDTVNVEKEIWNLKNEECINLKMTLENCEKIMNEKDRMIHSKSSKIGDLEELLKKKDDEIQLSNINQSNVTVQNETLKDELAQARFQNETTDGPVDEIRTECDTMKEMVADLTMAVKEKDFEVQSLNTKVSTLNKLLEEKGSDDEKIAKLLKDNEDLRNMAKTLQHERDQAMLVVDRCKQQINLLENEVSVVTDRESKLMKELERLREHLLHVEESYTREAIHAEEREKVLRNRLAVADEKALSSTNSYNSANHQVALQVESLKEQLHTLAEQRDDVLLKLSNSETQVEQLDLSLNNLQLVLEQFQQEKQRDIETVKQQMTNIIQEERTKGFELMKEMDVKEARLKEAMEALSAASRLSEQLDKKEDIIRSLKEEVNHKEDKLQKAVKQIQGFTSNNNGKVDKTIMKNLVLGYFITPQDKRQEVIRLLASVLDFNQQEVQKVGLDHTKKSNWLGWLGNPGSSSDNHSSSSENSSNKNSFSEAFIEFLQMESQPQIQVKLPAEQMAQELTQKSKVFSKEPSHLKPLKINPFTASVSQMSPIQKSSSHLLMKPISESLPTFTPLPVSESTTTNILKDVLKQD